PKGFDAACYQDEFINGLSIGAPPDMMFRGGQDWGFHPLDPAAQIKNRFGYLRACFRHYFRYAKIVRIDHVMGLQRLYCIPAGQAATEGSYLYYPFDAQLALLCLMAWQQEGILIGEDLGTVSSKVRKALTKRGINRMWVGQFELKRDWTKSFGHMNQTMMACMNTHDMFPFTAYIQGIDIDRFHALGLINVRERKAQHKDRAQVTKSLKAEGDPYLTYLSGMADSKARYLMVNFEDLWDETEPQNMPGITDAYPNWRKKFRQPIDGWAELPKVKQALKILNQQRSNS
ncbi:MAG: 4-alpha-glucanotransferase, partial [Pseudomonadota bacterium]